MDEQVSEKDTIRQFYEAIVASRAVADQIGLTTVAIKLDGAVVELEKILAKTEPPSQTP